MLVRSLAEPSLTLKSESLSRRGAIRHEMIVRDLEGAEEVVPVSRGACFLYRHLNLSLACWDNLVGKFQETEPAPVATSESNFIGRTQSKLCFLKHDRCQAQRRGNASKDDNDSEGEGQDESRVGRCF